MISDAKLVNGAAMLAGVDMCIRNSAGRIDVAQRCAHIFRHETLAGDFRGAPAVRHVTGKDTGGT